MLRRVIRRIELVEIHWAQPNSINPFDASGVFLNLIDSKIGNVIAAASGFASKVR